MGHRPMHEGHHDTVGRRKKRVMAGRRVGKTDVLDEIGKASGDAKGQSRQQVVAIHVLRHAAREQPCHHETRQHEPDA